MKDRNEILSDVAKERERQDAKWGEQNWDHVRPELLPIMPMLEKNAKMNCELFAKEGTVSWFDILSEEVYEAFAATDIDEQIKELTQVAAVAVSAIECLERRRNAGSVQES